MTEQARVAATSGWKAWILALPAIIVSVLFGFAVFLVVVGLVATLALYLGVRIWWQRRQWRKRSIGTAIDAEYTVVREPDRTFPRE